MGRTEIVEAHVLDAGFPPGEVPEREAVAARLGRIERRGKHVRAVAARLPVQNAPGLGIERNLSGSGLAVGQNQHVAPDLGPAQPHDLTPAAPGQQQKPDDVGLRPEPRRAPGPLVQDLAEASDLLP
ncbi:MAG: hypothetical protein OXF79_28205 [Chloroflexi bacterium]|nr:hypothetical protein [Chloroflexota bacterium]